MLYPSILRLQTYDKHIMASILKQRILTYLRLCMVLCACMYLFADYEVQCKEIEYLQCLTAAQLLKFCCLV